MRTLAAQIPRMFLAVIPCVLLVVGLAMPAHALLAAHLNYDGCDTCHNLHSGAGGALLDISANPEELCLSCHGPGGISALTVATHNLAGVASTDTGYISCNECHNSHNNGEETSRTNLDGTYNIKLVGLTLDYNSSPPVSLTSPQIREERVATGLGTLQDVVYSKGPIDDYARADNIGVCNACHGPTSGIHNVGKDCSACHAHDGGFAGAGDCRACHDGTGVGAEAVSVSSPHSTNTIYNSTSETFTCENCHTGHLGTIQVPNNSAVGINYSSTGHNGISLGNSGGGVNDANGATEAEICWNCHDLLAVSEWGENSDTNAGFPNYNTGTLSGTIAPAWVNADGSAGATWHSAKFSYKEGPIQSTHSVNGTSGVSGRDAVDNIRCSYCHDVHDLNLLASDTSSGKPYLRGSWAGNPYPEDGAPRSDAASSLPGDSANYSAYDVGGKFGAVPRGGLTYTALGGYFIDQNSSDPTNDPAMNSPDKFGGLCALCHDGNGDASWSISEINAINKFGDASLDWVGTNGHSAVVKGGDGLDAVNLFTSAKRHPTTAWAAYTGNGSQRGNPVMAFRNARNSNRGTWGNNYWAQGLRGTDGTAFGFSPRVDTSTRQYNYGNYDWGATVVVENSDGTMTDSGIDGNYHQFTCSKCHNPHASRLPRLLVTNCLDTNHNTWDDAFPTSADTALAEENRNVTVSQVTSAQNCHRLADPNYPQAGPQGTTDGGWNRVTPWREF
ncbi:MAG: cytochrome c3 family protein [Desulfuromonadales bacterium]|nr:cytochrome c3 family protein [Desulfuromonadales bacterium]